MNDELSSKQGRSLDERFKSRPQVYARLQQIADVMDQAMAEGCTADQAETMTVEQIRKLGGELLSDWAQDKHTRRVEQAQQEHPQAIRHAKKK
jgi:L-serine deaminase